MKKIFLLFTFMLAGILSVAATDDELTLEEVFDSVAKIDRFEVMDFDGGEMGFPDNFGNGKMAIHPNASPKEEVSALINRLPEGSLVYDDTDEKGRFDRIFIVGETSLLYVHVGSGTADTVVILFKDGNKKKIRDFINKIDK